MKGVNRFALRPGWAWLVSASALAVGLGAPACGDAVEIDGGLPLVTIVECEDMGGVPLFDPEDERPVEMSCPDGLEAIAEFDEDFYGSEGGVCCTSDDSAGDDAAGDDAADDNAPDDDAPSGSADE